MKMDAVVYYTRTKINKNNSRKKEEGGHVDLTVTTRAVQQIHKICGFV